jgi:hypothetical protein
MFATYLQIDCELGVVHEIDINAIGGGLRVEIRDLS